MGCLLLVVSLITPRLVVALLWLFSNWFDGVFHGALIPVLGFIFLPYTLLWYTVVVNWFGGVWGFWQIAFLVVAIIADMSSSGGGAKHRFSRR